MCARLLPLPGLLLLAACAPDPGDEGLPDAGARAILSMPVTNRHTCALESGPASLAPPAWSGDHGLAASGTRFLVARVEAAADPYTAPGTLVVSAWSPAGEEDRQVVATGTIAAGFALGAFAAREDGWALVHHERGAHLTLFDGARRTTRDLAALGGIPAQAYLFAREGGGFTYVAALQPEPRARMEIRLALLDQTGALEGELRTLYTEPEGGWGLTLAASPRALAWAEGSEAGTRILAAPLAADGTLGAPVTIRETALVRGTFWSARPAILPLGEALFVAWVEAGTVLGERPDAAGTVELRNPRVFLARLDARAERVAGPYVLTEPEPNVEHVEPGLFDLDGELALVWSRGSVIYECAGCMPDHDLRMVLLSPELAPVSEVLALPWDAAGGLLGHRGAVVGAELAISAFVQHHTGREPAIAFVRCP